MAKTKTTEPKIEEIKIEMPSMEAQEKAAPLPVTEEHQSEIKNLLAELDKPLDMAQLEKSKEERLVDFVAEKGKGDWIRINDFLKSLYPILRFGAPAAYLQQNESKKLKLLLDNMVAQKLIQIKNNAHLGLGKTYYEGEAQLSKQHNIISLQLEAKI